MAASPASAAEPATLTAWLGYGGLLPFVGLAAVVAAGSVPLASQALFAYGAVILSFVGALHWGFAMTLPGLPARSRPPMFLWSVIPALLGWVALLTTAPVAATILVAGFLAQYFQDLRVARRAALPAWYRPLRLRLTAVACLSLAVGGVAAVYR